MSKEYIHTEKAPSAIGAYSQAVKSGDLVFLSGQIPLNPETMKLVSEDVSEQINQVFINLNYVLEASDSSLEKILKLNVYLTNLEHFDKVNLHMRTIFSKPYPARAVIEVKGLPRGALIEIDAIASVK